MIPTDESGFWLIKNNGGQLLSNLTICGWPLESVHQGSTLLTLISWVHLIRLEALTAYLTAVSLQNKIPELFIFGLSFSRTKSGTHFHLSSRWKWCPHLESEELIVTALYQKLSLQLHDSLSLEYKSFLVLFQIHRFAPTRMPICGLKEEIDLQAETFTPKLGPHLHSTYVQRRGVGKCCMQKWKQLLELKCTWHESKIKGWGSDPLSDIRNAGHRSTSPGWELICFGLLYDVGM